MSAAPPALPAPDGPGRAVRAAGALYLVTFLASIPAVALLGPLLDDPAAYVLGAGADGRVVSGALLDVVNAAACVGTAVLLHRVLRRRAPARALGLVAARTLEAAVIMSGVVALLAVVNLRQAVADGSLAADGLPAVAQGLVAVRDWTFLLGPGLLPAVNALLLASVLWQERLVPRWIPALGLVGAPLQAASVVSRAFGVTDEVSAWSAVAVAPIFVWELAVGLRMLLRGFDGPAEGPVERALPGRGGSGGADDGNRTRVISLED